MSDTVDHHAYMRAPRMQSAAALAATFHHGQVDKQGKPYIGHPLRVAHSLIDFGIKDMCTLEAAVLHDVIEDTEATPGILRMFGIEKRTIRLVERVTRRDGITYRKFIDSIAEYPDVGASFVKAADMLDNLSPSRVLEGNAGEGLRRRYWKGLDRLIQEHAPIGVFVHHVRGQWTKETTE